VRLKPRHSVTGPDTTKAADRTPLKAAKLDNECHRVCEERLLLVEDLPCLFITFNDVSKEHVVKKYGKAYTRRHFDILIEIFSCLS